MSGDAALPRSVIVGSLGDGEEGKAFSTAKDGDEDGDECWGWGFPGSLTFKVSLIIQQ